MWRETSKLRISLPGAHYVSTVYDSKHLESWIWNNAINIKHVSFKTFFHPQCLSPSLHLLCPWLPLGRGISCILYLQCHWVQHHTPSAAGLVRCPVHHQPRTQWTHPFCHHGSESCVSETAAKQMHVSPCLLQPDKHVYHSPVDGRGSPVARQQGGVVDDRAVFRVVDDLHGDELGAKGQNIEFSTCGLVLSYHLWDGLALHTPAGGLEYRNTIFLRFSCCDQKKYQSLQLCCKNCFSKNTHRVFVHLLLV